MIKHFTSKTNSTNLEKSSDLTSKTLEIVPLSSVMLLLVILSLLIIPPPDNNTNSSQKKISKPLNIKKSYAQASKANILQNIEDILQIKEVFSTLLADKVGRIIKVKNSNEG